MAFLSRLGNLLRQTSDQINSDIASRPSIYQAARCMSSKLFIGGISYSTDDQSLTEAFSKYGEVQEARVIVDRETGRSRGFGFITFLTSEAASSAIQALDGQELHGRRVRVNFATERRAGFGGGGGGGYNSGYGGGGGYNSGYGGGGGYNSGYGGGGGGGYNSGYGGGAGGGYNSGYGGGAGGGYNSGYGAPSGPGYGGGNAADGGDGFDSRRGYNNTYGGGNTSFGSANTFDNAGSSSSDYGVAFGSGSSNAAGFEGNTGFSFDADKVGSSDISNKSDATEGFGQDEPLDSNLRDDDDDDFAKRA